MLNVLWTLATPSSEEEEETGATVALITGIEYWPELQKTLKSVLRLKNQQQNQNDQEKLDNTQEKLDNTQEKLDNTQEKLDNTQEKQQEDL